MVKGYIINKWTDEGLANVVNFPKELSVGYDDLMRIFYAHITGAGKAGNLVVRLENAQANISSYYTGMEEGVDSFMINLVFDFDEEPEEFGEAAIQVFTENILKMLRNPSKSGSGLDGELTGYLKNALFLLDRIKNMTKEQKISQIFSSERGRYILELLQETPLSKAVLKGKIEDKIKKFIPNFEIVLDPFMKTDLIKQDWIEGFNDLYLFLLTDVIINRTPVTQVYEEAQKNKPNSFLAKQYIKNVKDFFSTYTLTQEDSIKIAQAMINPDIFDFIVLLRNKPYPLPKLPKSPRDAIVKVQDLLDQMEKDKLIIKIKDEAGVPWVFLLSDVAVNQFYPNYMVDKIRSGVTVGKIKKEIAVHHLEILEKVYKK